MILGADWVLPVDGAPIAGGAVRVEGGEIAEVGAGLEPDQRFDGCVILPGLVNAHSHLEYAGMSGFGDGRPFDGWIADHIRRREGLGRDDYLAQARAGVAECLAGGVTTIADCCYAGTVADAAAEAGMRAIVYLEAFSRPRRARRAARAAAGRSSSRARWSRPGSRLTPRTRSTCDDYRALDRAGPRAGDAGRDPPAGVATWTSIRPRTSATSWARTRS